MVAASFSSVTNAPNDPLATSGNAYTLLLRDAEDPVVFKTLAVDDSGNVALVDGTPVLS